MHSGPSFTKPAHQYGQAYGDLSQMLDGAEAPEDEEWAGLGFTQLCEEREG